ncbi:MAG: hypothetical protein KIT09_28080 [Bryobacteraceae bacterium]|nr:hypothetical protein [Bryobacteraceae bacterium]
MTAREFLELLWSGKPEALYILIWTLQDKRSYWLRDIGQAAAIVEACRQMDIYVGVGLSPDDFGPHQRCPAEKIAGVAGQWADFDIRGDAHSRKALPRTIDEALSIIPAALPPTIVISTGNGAHAWWLYKEPSVFETDADRQEAAALAARFQTLLRYNAAPRGWAFDRLADLPRVLRIPGTSNCKDPANPKPVAPYSFTGRRYNPSDIEEYLDELGIPDTEAQRRAAREWAEHFEDKPLVVNTGARIPDETLERWMEADLRFRNTWLRQRHDLRDQSQSGYDLALACFGVDAGLTEQQIVDLIVHHRSVHNERQRTRVDYFQRTLAKAARGREAIDPIAILSGAPQPAATASAGEISPPASAGAEPQQPDPEIAKAILCERISQVLGVRVLRIVKVTGKEPTYQMELESATLEFSNVGKLIDQSHVRVAIASAANQLIPKIKPRAWEQLAQTMLDALIETDGGDETDFKGSIRMYINQYLTDAGFIETIENQPPNSLRSPTIIGGRIAICSSDLQPHVNKTFSQALSVKAIASMLAAIGARNIQVKGKTFKPQSRWLLPVEEFHPADFTVLQEQNA